MNSKTRSITRRSAAAAGAAVLVVLGASTGAISTSGSGSSNVAFADPVPGIGPLPLSCTGAPIDAYTTCAVGGHAPPGGNAGDATGGDTPVLGGGNSEGGNPPAG